MDLIIFDALAGLELYLLRKFRALQEESFQQMSYHGPASPTLKQILLRIEAEA
jgi:hypothetical protein